MTNLDKRRRDIDWDAIEHDYRSAALSLRELAHKHGCSHSTIANLASRKGWLRNPSQSNGAETPAALAGRKESLGPHHGSA